MALEILEDDQPGCVDDFDGNLRLARTLKDLRRFDEALLAARCAISLNSESSEAHENMGEILLAMGAAPESLGYFRRATTLKPGNAQVHQRLICALTVATDDPSALIEECRRFSLIHEMPLLRQATFCENERTLNRKLRIGFVSAEFRAHSLALFMMPALSMLVHSRFERVCYSGVRDPDPITQQIKSLADIWRDVHDLNDADLANLIRADKIDILVDLDLHLRGSRLLTFARRPAPIQLQWLGYSGTTGCQSVQYRLTDPWIDLPDDPKSDAIYSEKLVRLPQTFACYEPLAGLGNTIPTVAPLPARRNRHITFGCLAAMIKLGDRTLRLWALILEKVPAARLMLYAPEASRRSLSARLNDNGIDVSRVDFVPFQSRLAYLATYNHIDIGLETIPYHGYTTSLDAAWMGVPTPTRVGEAHCSRAGRSILMNLNLGHLVADDDAQYVEIVTRLANDIPGLAALRARLRRRLEHSAIMDTQRFSRDLANAFSEMWKAWCESPPNP